MSDVPRIPDDVRALLEQVVDSFEKLETVLLLHRRGGPCTTAAISKELGLDHESTMEALTELRRSKLVHRRAETDEWTLAPRSTWRGSVAGLIELQRTDRLELLKLMSGLAIQRVRAQAARTFAEAFVLRAPARSTADDTASDAVEATSDDDATGPLVLDPKPR